MELDGLLDSEWGVSENNRRAKLESGWRWSDRW
jgi:hypothetical protein